jgi:hypothetical protein
MLVVWLAAIVGVDALRLALEPALGWLNMLLVWGWLHQAGYELPRLRRQRPALLLACSAVAFAAAVALAVLGPYSTSMVTYQGDDAPSNLAPPTVVVALHGLALILLLAAMWGPLARVLARPALWTPVALLAARGIGLYLWHIPLVGIAAGLALLLGIEVAPLSPAWWTIHIAVAGAVIGGAWLLAGAAQRVLPLVERIPGRRSVRGAAPLTALAGLLVLLLSVTGFASWWAEGFLGAPASTPAVMGALWLLWRARPSLRSESPAGGSPPTPGAPPSHLGRTAASG